MAEVIDIMKVLKERLGASRAPAKAARAAAAPAQQPSRRSSGRGTASRSSGDSLSTKSKKELYKQAKELEVENRSQMSKDELVEAIRAAR